MIINHIRGIKPSTKTLKQRKLIPENCQCFLCKNWFLKRNIEIEHIIPVCIGGNINDINFCCKDCHKKKTKKDIIFINFCKKIGMMVKIGKYEYEIFNKNIVNIYKLIMEDMA